MAAPKNNNFWEIRSRHGRKMLFETPVLMWEAACEYFEWCIDNPLIEFEPKVTSDGNNNGSSVEMVEIPKMRVFTLHGLCSYLDCNTEYFRNFKNQDRAKKEDFSSVIRNIEETIYNQKFSGAAAGFLNANLISRDLGLVDKKEVEANVTAKQIFKIGDNEIEF